MDESWLHATAFGWLVAWVILPLMPAVLIYWLFPSTTVTAAGPLSNLTIKASGAFAGYLIVFAATSFVVRQNHNQIHDRIDGLKREYWTVQAKVRFVDRSGREIQSEDYRRGILVTTEPLTWKISPYDEQTKAYSTTVKVPKALEDGALPNVIFQVEKFGQGSIDLGTTLARAKAERSSSKSVEHSKRTVVISEPITIRQAGSQRDRLEAPVADPGR